MKWPEGKNLYVSLIILDGQEGGQLRILKVVYFGVSGKIYDLLDPFTECRSTWCPKYPSFHSCWRWGKKEGHKHAEKGNSKVKSFVLPRFTEVSSRNYYLELLICIILHYNMYSFHFTLQDLLNLLAFLAETFRCHVHHFQCLTGLIPPGLRFFNEPEISDSGPPA